MRHFLARARADPEARTALGDTLAAEVAAAPTRRPRPAPRRRPTWPPCSPSAAAARTTGSPLSSPRPPCRSSRRRPRTPPGGAMCRPPHRRPRSTRASRCPARRSLDLIRPPGRAPRPHTAGMRSMRVIRLVVHATTRQPLVVLGETDGDRCLPVFLRQPQADVIAVGPRGQDDPLLPQDVLTPVLRGLGHTLDGAEITELTDGVSAPTWSSTAAPGWRCCPKATRWPSRSASGYPSASPTRSSTRWASPSRPLPRRHRPPAPAAARRVPQLPRRGLPGGLRDRRTLRRRAETARRAAVGPRPAGVQRGSIRRRRAARPSRPRSPISEPRLPPMISAWSSTGSPSISSMKVTGSNRPSGCG